RRQLASCRRLFVSSAGRHAFLPAAGRKIDSRRVPALDWRLRFVPPGHFGALAALPFFPRPPANETFDPSDYWLGMSRVVGSVVAPPKELAREIVVLHFS